MAELIPDILYYAGRPAPNLEPTAARIHMFDLDNTIVSNPSKMIKPKSASDWHISPIVLAKLQQLGHIVIISNQADADKIPHRFERIKQIYEYLEHHTIKAQIYVIVGKNKYRKPYTALYEQYIYFPGIKCSYVGDAAGRQGDAHHHVDFSDSDRAFAYNISLYHRLVGDYSACINFYTPEHCFSPPATRPNAWLSVDPRDMINQSAAVNNAEVLQRLAAPMHPKLGMIIIISPPCSDMAALIDHLMQNGIAQLASSPDELTTILQGGRVPIVTTGAHRRQVRQSWLDLLPKTIPKQALIIDYKYARDLIAHLNLNRLWADEPLVATTTIAAYYAEYEQPAMSEGKYVDILTWQFDPATGMFPRFYFRVQG